MLDTIQLVFRVITIGCSLLSLRIFTREIIEGEP